MAGKATSKTKETADKVPATKPEEQQSQAAAPADQATPAAPASTGESPASQQTEQPAPEPAAPAPGAVAFDPASGESKTGVVLVGTEALRARIAAALNAAPELQVEIDAAAEVAADVFVERLRQIIEEGHSVEQDDAYTDYQLPRAAVCYAIRGAGLPPHKATLYWPWNPAAFKPAGDDRDLIKAAALILAELQRRQRARAEA
ncbi:hypothetical protein JR044_31180 [Pseudomonas aeruginosa]|uniref:hypothetical protein n=1 Tax=Pseudomonas aeruginosa TaxID=287 RepID=UPI001BD6D854|nr:hypothetical protein [Pseudomonas aeruginosa]MBS9758459.1 hypothetical protein [Pseudomonas aeruginosa]